MGVRRNNRTFFEGKSPVSFYFPSPNTPKFKLQTPVNSEVREKYDD
jgi:hypothetical protein